MPPFRFAVQRVAVALPETAMPMRFLALAAIVAIPTAAMTQQVTQSRVAFARETLAGARPTRGADVPAAPRTAEMVLHGTLAGAIGALAGLAATVTSVDCEDTLRCDLTTLWIGVGAGVTILIPAGVHTAGRRTPYVAKLLASSMALAAGLALARHTHNGSLVATPVAQLAATVALEHLASEHGRRTSQRR